MRRTFNRLARCAFFVVLVLTALNLFSSPPSLGQATQVMVVVPTGIEVYTRFDVDVTVANVADLYAWQVKLYYNSIALKWISATLPAGNIFDERLHTSESATETDAGGAYVLCFATLLANARSFTGSGVLCRITFEAEKEGTAKLDFSKPLGPDGDTWLSDYDLSYDISFTAVGASATIQESTDTTSPNIQTTCPLNNSEVKDRHLTISWDGTDDRSGMGYYEVRIDAGTWINLELSTNYTVGGLGEGSHTFDLKAFDRNGNVNQTTTVFSVNTSPLFWPGYIDEAAIGVAAVASILGIIIYFSKAKKPKNAKHDKKLH